MKKPTLIACACLVAAIAGNAQQKDFPELAGPYLGQKPPGMTPEKFPFDFMPAGYKLHSAPAFSPDGKYFFFLKLVSTPWKCKVYRVQSSEVDYLDT